MQKRVKERLNSAVTSLRPLSPAQTLHCSEGDLSK